MVPWQCSITPFTKTLPCVWSGRLRRTCVCECVCHSYGDTLLVIGFAFSSFSTFLAPLSGAATISMWFAHLLLFLSSSSSCVCVCVCAHMLSVDMLFCCFSLSRPVWLEDPTSRPPPWPLRFVVSPPGFGQNPSVLTSVALSVHEGLCMCGWATSRIFNPSPSHTVLQLWLIQGGGRKKWQWACAQTRAHVQVVLCGLLFCSLCLSDERIPFFMSFHVIHKSYSSLGVEGGAKINKNHYVVRFNFLPWAAELKKVFLESCHPSSSSN